MFRRNPLNTASVVAALIIAPVSALYSQTPQDSSGLPSSSGLPPWDSRSSHVPQTTPGQTPAASRSEVFSDSGFIRDALNGNLVEIRLGTVARSKASDGGVRDFGQRMVKDHTSLYNQWAALAKQQGLSTDVNADATAKATADQLATLSGADFDRAYMTEMVRDHQADIAKFQQAGSSANAAVVRELAAKAVPVMQQHLSQAQQLASQVGATAVATGPITTPSQPQRSANDEVIRSRDRTTRDRDLAAADRQYVNEVAVGHVMEVRLAEMARNKARDPDVKKFADRMHDDFTKWLSRWEDLGAKDPHMGPLHRKKIEQLDKANRNQFDRTYLEIVRENLGSMIPYFQREGRSSNLGRVRNLVKDELPTLERNLQAAERLDRQSRADRSSDRDKDRSLSTSK